MDTKFEVRKDGKVNTKSAGTKVEVKETEMKSLTLTQAAKKYDKNPQYIRKLGAEGKIKFTQKKIGDTNIPINYYDVESIEKYLEGRNQNGVFHFDLWCTYEQAQQIARDMGLRVEKHPTHAHPEKRPVS